MTRTTFYIILLCVFLVFLGITGWIVHWNIQFRKDLFLSTFIEVENDKELRKKFEDVERFAEDFKQELAKANKKANGQWKKWEKEVNNAPNDSVPKIFVNFLREQLDVDPNTFYKIEDGNYFYVLENGPARIELNIDNNLLSYKILGVRDLDKFLLKNRRLGDVEEKPKPNSDGQSIKKRTQDIPPMINVDSFNAALIDQLAEANQQTSGQWSKFETQLRSLPKEQVMPKFIKFIKQRTGKTKTSYEEINKDTTLFHVQKILYNGQDTTKLIIRIAADNDGKLKMDKPLNVDEFLIKHYALTKK